MFVLLETKMGEFRGHSGTRIPKSPPRTPKGAKMDQNTAPSRPLQGRKREPKGMGAKTAQSKQ